MKKKKYIDINADLGEGFGIYKICDDDKLLPFISSANVACGFHSGDPQIMRNVVKLAKKHKVAIGAHISLPDLQGFGRRKIDFTTSEIKNIALYQIGALYAITKSEDMHLQHIKLHGALYHMASEDKKVATPIAEAIISFNKQMWWIGFPNSYQEEIAEKFQIKFASEGFVDRNYDKNGNLLPRTNPDAIVKSPLKAAKMAVNMVLHKKIISNDGITLKADVKTICIHSDTPNSVEIAKTVFQSLKNHNIFLKSLNHIQRFDKSANHQTP